MNDLERLCRIMGTFDLATGHAETMSDALDALEEELRDVLGHLRARREWVGLTEDEIEKISDRIKGDELLVETSTWHIRFAKAIERKLKEKNSA